jgi:Na+/melibiose symporter-like transporter
MNTLIGALATFVVVILALYLVNLLPLDAQAKQIVTVIVIIIGIVSLLKYLAVFDTSPPGTIVSSREACLPGPLNRVLEQLGPFLHPLTIRCSNRQAQCKSSAWQFQ